MRFWTFLILIFIMFSGCGISSKEYKITKATILQKKNYIGNDIYVINSQKHLLWIVNNDHNHSSEFYALKQVLTNVNLIKKTWNGYELKKITSKEVKDGKFWLYDLGYDKKKNQYSLSGKYTYMTDKKDKKSMKFVAIYDSISSKVKSLYYKTKGEKEDVYISNNGKYIVFTGFGECIILNIDTQRSVNFVIPKHMYSFWNKNPKFSKNGKYVAFFLEQKTNLNNKEIILVDLKTGKIKQKFVFHNGKYTNTSHYSYNFSDDEKLFFYKGYGEKFKVYDIDKAQIIDSFGISNYKNVRWESNKSIVDKNYLMAIYHVGYNNRSKGRASILNLYNINKNKVVCRVENKSFHHSFVDEKNNILHIVAHFGPTKMYRIEEDTCKKIGEVNEDKYKNIYYNKLKILQSDTIYWLDNGIVKKFIYKKIDMIELDNLILQ